MTTTQVHHTISRTADATPGPTSAAWLDPMTVQRIAHPSIHTRPQPNCHLCPPVPCRCGVADCPDEFEHRRNYSGAEATLLELSA